MAEVIRSGQAGLPAALVCPVERRYAIILRRG
jgi:hypothetical protein